LKNICNQTDSVTCIQFAKHTMEVNGNQNCSEVTQKKESHMGLN